ncbi:MAG: NifU family protein [Candidatus Limnocylindrales bacterium]
MSDASFASLASEEVLERIATLAEELTQHPDVGERVTELLDWVDAFHRDGLGRLIEMIRAWRGEIFLEAVAGDALAGTMLAAYDLNETARESAEQAVERALAEIRPLAASHGGAIDVVRIVDGVVEVRLDGACDGCPSSAATLTHGVEAALRRHWVSFRRLEVVEMAQLDPAKDHLICPVPTDEPGLGSGRGSVFGSGAAPVAQAVQIRGHELA